MTINRRGNFIEGLKVILTIKIGLITSVAIIVFFIVEQLTIYRYLKTEYYAAIVAAAFLATGVAIAKINTKKAAIYDNEPKPLSPRLTVKEQWILTQIANGKSNKEIAAENFIELSTVKTHINNIYGKLGVTNRQEAIKAHQSA